MSGRAHIIQGTFRPDRHGEADTPEPPKGVPVPPKTLNAEEQGEWDRMVGRLEQSKTLSLVDDAALYEYVQLFAEKEMIKSDDVSVRKLSKDLRRAIKDLEGAELVQAIEQIVKLQLILPKHSQQLRQGHMAIRQYLVEFGMTPSARTRVKVASGEKPMSKIDQLLAGMKKA